MARHALMDMAQLDRAKKLERTYDRRAARTRRSKWLGRVLFSLLGMGLMLGLRSHPDMVADVVTWAAAPSSQTAQRETLVKPSDTRVRRMPNDFVPVRRGNTLPGKGLKATPPNTQAHADAVGNTLRGLGPDG